MDAEVYEEKLGEILREVEKVDAIVKTFTKDNVSIDEYDEKLYMGKLEKINDAEENCQNKILELVYLELDEKNAVDKGRIESVRSLGEELMMRVKKNAREVTTKMAELKPFLPMSEDEKKALELLKREFEKRKAEIEKEEAVSGEEMLSDSNSEALKCVPFDENFKAVSNEAFDNNNEVPAKAFDDSCNAQSGAAPSKSLDDENDVPEVCAESCVIAQTEISEVESCVILQTEILVNDKISLANDDDTCAVYQSDVENCPERKLEENCEMCCCFQGKCVCLSEQPEHAMSNGHNEDVMTVAESGDWKCLTPSLEDLLIILNSAKDQKCNAVLDAVQNDDENSSIEGLDEAAKAFDNDIQFKPLCDAGGEYVPCIVGGLPEMKSGDESEPPGKVDVNSDAVFDDDETQRCLNEDMKHYIPTSIAYKETSASTKCRICWDSSRSSRESNSLNSILLKGTSEYSVVKMLVRFRENRIGVSADIRKFYSTLRLDPSHYKFHMALWRPNMLPEEDAIELVLLVHFYGVRSRGVYAWQL